VLDISHVWAHDITCSGARYRVRWVQDILRGAPRVYTGARYDACVAQDMVRRGVGMSVHAGARYDAGDTTALCIRTLGARYLVINLSACAGGSNEVIRVRLPWVSVLYHCSEGVRMISSRRLEE
jgi:hypothetical protein